MMSTALGEHKDVPASVERTNTKSCAGKPRWSNHPPLAVLFPSWLSSGGGTNDLVLQNWCLDWDESLLSHERSIKFLDCTNPVLGHLIALL
jgi:hypothetical protein